MKDIGEIKKEIIDALNKDNYRGDFGDIGNTIGIVIGKYIDTEIGYDKESLISGIKHGISLSDGTH